jgi:hypothetical protein
VCGDGTQKWRSSYDAIGSLERVTCDRNLEAQRAYTETLAMGRASQTVKGYIWWTYPRGSVHYDVMVTLILAFIFLMPLWINFRDKPQERPPRQTEVVVQQEGDGFIYKVDASAVKQGNDNDIRDSLLRIIEPVAGEITIDRYEPIRDKARNIIAYKVWGHR